MPTRNRVGCPSLLSWTGAVDYVPQGIMEPACSSSSNSIGVLVADSNQMQCQLLVSALRRRPEFKVTSCILDPDVILRVIGSAPVEVCHPQCRQPQRRLAGH